MCVCLSNLPGTRLLLGSLSNRQISQVILANVISSAEGPRHYGFFTLSGAAWPRHYGFFKLSGAAWPRRYGFFTFSRGQTAMALYRIFIHSVATSQPGPSWGGRHTESQNEAIL